MGTSIKRDANYAIGMAILVECYRNMMGQDIDASDQDFTRSNSCKLYVSQEMFSITIQRVLQAARKLFDKV